MEEVEITTHLLELKGEVFLKEEKEFIRICNDAPRFPFPLQKQRGRVLLPTNDILQIRRRLMLLLEYEVRRYKTANFALLALYLHGTSEHGEKERGQNRDL
jgi:hypothetical protein